MAAALPDKVSRLIPLLGSDRDGEIVATVHAIKRALQAAGMDFHDLAAAAIARPAKTVTPRSRRAPDWTTNPDWPAHALWQRVQWCVERVDLLSPADRSFVLGITGNARREVRLSAKQRQWLDDIVAKLQRLDEEAA